MSTLRNRLSQLFVLAVLGAAVWLAVIAVRRVFDLSKDQLTVVGAVVAGLLSYFGSRSIERRKVLEASIRAQKTAMYEEFIEFLLKSFLPGAGDREDDEFQAFFAKMTPMLVTYASNGVIKAWGNFRLGVESWSAKERVLNFEKLLKAVRDDLGLRSMFLPDQMLLKLFLNDLDELK